MVESKATQVECHQWMEIRAWVDKTRGCGDGKEAPHVIGTKAVQNLRGTGVPSPVANDELLPQTASDLPVLPV